MATTRFDLVKSLSKKASSERLGKFVGFVEALEKKGPRRRMRLFGLRNVAWEEAVNYRRGPVEARAYDKGKRIGAKDAMKIIRTIQARKK